MSRIHSVREKEKAEIICVIGELSLPTYGTVMYAVTHDVIFPIQNYPNAKNVMELIPSLIISNKSSTLSINDAEPLPLSVVANGNCKESLSTGSILNWCRRNGTIITVTMQK